MEKRNEKKREKIYLFIYIIIIKQIYLNINVRNRTTIRRNSLSQDKNMVIPERRKYICDTCRRFDIFSMLILFLPEAFVRRDGWSQDY